MLLAHEPLETNISLFKKGKETWIDDYKLSNIPGKMLIIRKGESEYRHYDTYPWFQSSFIKALEKAQIPIPEIVTRGKQERLIGFSNLSESELREYNFQETVLVAQLMTKLKDSLRAANPKYARLRDWFGPAVLGKKILRQAKIQDKKEIQDLSWEGETTLSAMCDELNEEFAKFGIFNTRFKPENLVQVLKHHSQGYGSLPGQSAEILEYKRRMAYFGGHIEMFRRGEFEKVWNADVTSEYPYAAMQLPALDSCKWKVFDNFSERDLENYEQGIVEVRWKGDYQDTMGPFPFRGDGTDYEKHRNFCPNVCESGDGYLHGYYHLIEVREAVRKGLWDIRFPGFAVVIEEAKEYPFRDHFGNLLEYRAKLKAEGNYANIPLKLGLNSGAYGVLAQRMGRRDFYQLFYAGAITAYGRAQLLKFVNPETIILVATDGLYATERPSMPNEPDIPGKWEVEGPEYGRFVLPGLYQWGDITHTQGYPKDVLNFDNVFDSCMKGLRPKVEAPLFLTAKQCIVGRTPKTYHFSKKFPRCGFYNRGKQINWDGSRGLWLSNTESYPLATSQQWSMPYSSETSLEIEIEESVENTFAP